MRIAILGAGSLGSLVAAYLARAGNDVLLLAKPSQVPALETYGVTVGGLDQFTVRVPVTAEPAGLGRVDYLLVAVKTRDTVTALQGLGDLDVGVTASLQNGVVKDEQLIDRFGADRVVGAATILGATMQAPGVVEHTMNGPTYFGEFDGRSSERVAWLVERFVQAGLPAEATAEVRSVEWSKLCQICAAALLSALTRLEYVKILKEPDLASLFVQINREVAAVARASGVEVGDYPGFEVRTLVDAPQEEAMASVRERARRLEARGMTGVRISMLQDILRGRRTEVEETAGYVVRRAEALGVDVPGLRFAYRVVRGLDSYLDGEGR